MRRTNTRKTARRLTAKDAATIKGMLLRGDPQMDVALWYGVNQARISEIRLGKGCGARWRNIPPAPLSELPEPGPYVVMPEARAVMAAARAEVVEKIRALLDTLEYRGSDATTA